MTPLDQAILRTVVYFDLFHYPLTPWEVWKWGMGEAGGAHSYVEVEDALVSHAVLQEKLGRASGFVFLKGRDGLVATRQERYRLALPKLERAQRFASTLARIPFVRAVFACNSLGLANARVDSDIDLFIIVARGHVWATRLLAAGWAQARKLRPLPGDRRDRFCLSFFIADDALDLRALRLPDDPYLTMWVATLVPLYDPASLGASLWQANPWVQEVLPNASPRAVSAMREARPLQLALLRPLIGAAWFERLARRIQQRVLAPNLRALANQDTRVVLNDRMLKFHDNDRRQEYQQQFSQKLASLGVAP